MALVLDLVSRFTLIRDTFNQTTINISDVYFSQ